MMTGVGDKSVWTIAVSAQLCMNSWPDSPLRARVWF